MPAEIARIEAAISEALATAASAGLRLRAPNLRARLMKALAKDGADGEEET